MAYKLQSEYYLIINNNAGNGKAKQMAKEMMAVYQGEGIIVHPYFSNSINDVDSVLRKLASEPGHKNIYSIGGDGTLRGILSVLAPYTIKDKEKLENLILRVIPGGTGNDFYKMLGTDFPLQPIDLIKVNDQWAANIVSFGIDTEVAALANQYKASLTEGQGVGKDAYKRSINQAIKNNNPLILKYISYVDQDDVEHFIKVDFSDSKLPIVDTLADHNLYSNLATHNNNLQLTLLAICSGTTYGGSIKIGKGAKINDGLLKMVWAEHLMSSTHLKFLLLLLKLAIHELSKHVHSYNQIKEIRIKAPFTISCSMDGEIYPCDEFHISVVHNAINIDNDFTNEPGIQKIIEKYN